MSNSARVWLGLAGFILLCFAAAGAGSLFTARSVDGWYAELVKPPWNPPNWVFGPVWSLLYLAMAVAAWIVWRRDGAGAPVALGLFALQLVLNVAWSGLFFGLQAPGPAFVGIVLLWGAILAAAVAFWRIAPLAGALMTPYLVWVTFAAFLNFAIWRLNA